ncbi:hypothetical protein Tco_1469097 [Tanacetum coccineum]
MRLPSILDEGTRKSQPFPEGTNTDPKDSGGNVQPTDKGLPSMVSNEGTVTTMPLPEGPLGDKDLEGNKTPADMELINPTIVDLSGIGAKYQVDETQSTRLRYRSLTKNKGKTYVDIQAFMLSDDELDKESDEEEVLAARDAINEDPQDDKEHEEAAVSYVDLKASIDQYYDENIANRDQTDKLVEASMSSLDKNSTTINDLYKGLDVITQLLKDINTAGFGFSVLLSAVKSLRDYAFKQEEASTAWMKSKDTSEIKFMMTEIYAAFRGQPSSAPSSSGTSTLALTDIQANVEGENANTTATEEPPSHTEATPKIDKGKGIATVSDDDPSKKLIKPSSIVRPDLDEPVRVKFMINGKIVYLTEQEIQDYWDKEEQIKKAKEEAKLLTMTKPEVIKVVQEEAKKIGLDPKAIKGAKAGKVFKKAQDAEHAVSKDNILRKLENLLSSESTSTIAMCGLLAED